MKCITDKRKPSRPVLAGSPRSQDTKGHILGALPGRGHMHTDNSLRCTRATILRKFLQRSRMGEQQAFWQVFIGCGHIKN